MLWQFAALSLFWVLGVQDFRTKRVNNIIVLLLWIPSMALQPIYLLSTFIVLALGNEIVFSIQKKPLCGWGDVLMFGPYIALLMDLGYFYAAIGYFAFALALAYTAIIKNKVPLGMVFFLFYFVSSIVKGIIE